MAQGGSKRTSVLAKLQQFFLGGKRTDMVIRVRITGDECTAGAPAAAAAEATASAAAADDRYTDIKAHSPVLCAASAYFDKALSGNWVEATEGRVELTVKDEQELEDLKLLIKQSYADSCTHDGDGKLLPLATRLRLAVRADGLEFVEALNQVVASLPLGLDFAGVLTCLNELPPQLELHTGMASAQRGMVGVLLKGIAEREGKTDGESIKALAEGVNALAKCLGPVVGMFEEAITLCNGNLPLREEVKQLSYFVFERLLTSEALQLQLENEAYALLVAWVMQSPHANATAQPALFKAMAWLLRYHHMTTDFLANVVSQCSLMQKSGLLPSVVLSAFVQRDALPSLLKEEETGKRDRGVGASKASWKLRASFTLEEVAALQPYGRIHKWCGLVAGYPACLLVVRATEKGDTLGAYLSIDLPRAAVGMDETLVAGVGLEWTMTLSPDVDMEQSHFFSSASGSSWGYNDVFGKPWAEAVCEGSPHFPGGKMEVKATVKLAVKSWEGGGGQVFEV